MSKGTVKRVGLVGASGLIGSAIHTRLSEQMDITTFGRTTDTDRFLDLADAKSIDGADFGGLDAFIHAAGITDEEFRDNPERAFVRSTYLTSHLVAALNEAHLRQAVYVSTAHVYGAMTGRVNETNQVAPTSDYAISHHATERMISRLANPTCQVTILRPNAVFGVPPYPRTFARWGLIPFAFPKAAVCDGEIVLRSAGYQKRNFVAADDISQVIATKMVSAIQPESVVVNPVGSINMSVREFAHHVAKFVSDKYSTDVKVIAPARSPEDSATSQFFYESEARQYPNALALDQFLDAITDICVQDREGGRGDL